MASAILFFKFSMMEKFKLKEPFFLESGQVLHNLELAYHTLGTLNAQKDNCIWICHALTANSNPLEWWPDLVGPGKVIDTDAHFVVCANIIGSSCGSTKLDAREVCL